MAAQLEDVIRTKIEKTFRALDADDNGYIEWDDFQAVVDRQLAEFGLPSDDARARTFLAAYEAFWRELVRHAETDGDGRLSLTEYVAGTASAAASDSLSACTQVITDALFDVIDTDRDERVTDEEFVRLMSNVWGVPRPETLAAFAALDTDAGGTLSRQELFGVAQEFFFSADATAPGSRIFGDA
jgi:Ca2+-binding EF-hand superfamily protein